MGRREWILLLIVGELWFAPRAAADETPGRRPIVLFITTDQQSVRAMKRRGQ